MFDSINEFQKVFLIFFDFLSNYEQNKVQSHSIFAIFERAWWLNWFDFFCKLFNMLLHSIKWKFCESYVRKKELVSERYCVKIRKIAKRKSHKTIFAIFERAWWLYWFDYFWKLFGMLLHSIYWNICDRFGLKRRLGFWKLLC